MMLTRRRFITAASALAGAATLRRARAQSKPTIDVKKLGAFGDGKLPDLRQLRRACEMAAEHPGGATIYFPPGEYYMGAADASELLQITNLQNVRFVGERATISCRTVNGTPGMFVLAACRNISIEGLTFRDYGLNREGRSGAHAISFTNNGNP
jgi:polygalacturonase